MTKRRTHLERPLEAGDGSDAQSARPRFVPAAVRLPHTQEEHAGRQPRGQREGAVHPHV